MKLLLTSSGIANTSIHDALVGLLGKPVEEASALVIPTAIYPFPGGAGHAWEAISGRSKSPFAGLGWKSLGVLELSVLPSIDEECWVPAVQETDALLVWGGEVLYLCYWMWESGLADLLPSLRPEMVYVGVSGGSMVATPNFGVPFDGSYAPVGSERALGLVDFSLVPHMGHEMFPDRNPDGVKRFAAGLGVPTYGIDDQTAIKVVDGAVEVISEGNWKLFTP